MVIVIKEADFSNKNIETIEIEYEKVEKSVTYDNENLATSGATLREGKNVYLNGNGTIVLIDSHNAIRDALCFFRVPAYTKSIVLTNVGTDNMYGVLTFAIFDTAGKETVSGGNSIQYANVPRFYVKGVNGSATVMTDGKDYSEAVSGSTFTISDVPTDGGWLAFNIAPSHRSDWEVAITYME